MLVCTHFPEKALYLSLFLTHRSCLIIVQPSSYFIHHFFFDLYINCSSTQTSWRTRSSTFHVCIVYTNKNSVDGNLVVGLLTITLNYGSTSSVSITHSKNKMHFCIVSFVYWHIYDICNTPKKTRETLIRNNNK